MKARRLAKLSSFAGARAFASAVGLGVGLAANGSASGCGGVIAESDGDGGTASDASSSAMTSASGASSGSATSGAGASGFSRQPADSGVAPSSGSTLPPNAGCIPNVLTYMWSNSSLGACWKCYAQACSSQLMACAVDCACNSAMYQALVCTDQGTTPTTCFSKAAGGAQPASNVVQCMVGAQCNCSIRDGGADAR